MLIDDLGLKASEKGSLDRCDTILGTFHLSLFSVVSFLVRKSCLLLTEQSHGLQRCRPKTTGRSGNPTLKTDSVVNSERATMLRILFNHGEL